MVLIGTRKVHCTPQPVQCWRAPERLCTSPTLYTHDIEKHCNGDKPLDNKGVLLIQKSNDCIISLVAFCRVHNTVTCKENM